MNDPVRAARTHLTKFALVFALLCLPSFALRLWYPQRLSGFGQSRYGQIQAVLRRPPEVRMAFVGSSRILTALDAPRISYSLYGKPRAVLNFGVYNWGRGRDFLIAREILKIDSVERLVVEVGYREIGATVVSCDQPDELFFPKYWFDREHMNVKGASVMSERFVEHLRQLDHPSFN